MTDWTTVILALVAIAVYIVDMIANIKICKGMKAISRENDVLNEALEELRAELDEHIENCSEREG